MGVNMKITELDRYLFGEGTHYEIYKLLGAHVGVNRKKRRRFLCSMGASCKISFRSGEFQ